MASETRIPAPHFRKASEDPQLGKALVAEFVGVALFQLLAGSIAQGPVQLAFTYAAILFGVQWISGGHLNPAVSLAALGSGHIDMMRGATYIAAQLLGGVAGALLQAFMTPGEHFGRYSASACFAPVGLTGPQLWMWETLLTAFFIIVVYSAIFAAPGYGITAPLAAGLALFAVVSTGGMFTGFSPVNPARVVAAMVIFHCDLKWGWTYLTGQLAGGGLAILWAWWQFGKGWFFGGARPDVFTGTRGTVREGLLERDPAAPGAYHGTVGI